MEFRKMFITLICFCVVGVATANAGIKVHNWEFWAIDIAMFVHGINMMWD